MGRRILFCNSYEDFRPATEVQMRAIADLGVDVVRLNIHVPRCNPKRGAYDWSKPERDIKAIRLAGMRVLVNFCFAPPHWSNDLPAYGEQMDGCWAWNADAKTVMDVHFASERPYCSDPPHIGHYVGGKYMPDARMELNPAHLFGAMFAKEFRWSVWAYTIWNEPKFPLFWTPSFRPESDWMARLMREVVVPMTAGIRTWDRKAQFIGPDAAGLEDFEGALQYERDNDLEVYHGLSAHGYPNDPDWRHVFDRITDEYLPTWRRLGEGRPFMLDECDFLEPIPFIREIATRFPEVSLVGIHDYHRWFKPGSWDSNGVDADMLGGGLPGTWVPGVVERSALGDEYRELLRELKAGRSMRDHI